jgi:hypothetical protein
MNIPIKYLSGSLGTRKKIRYQLPSFLLVHCFANAPYSDQSFRYFI